jgi:hypothetical protein
LLLNPMNEIQSTYETIRRLSVPRSEAVCLRSQIMARITRNAYESLCTQWFNIKAYSMVSKHHHIEGDSSVGIVTRLWTTQPRQAQIVLLSTVPGSAP